MEEQILQLRKHLADKTDDKITLHFNETFLQNFINGRKGDIESAKKYIDAYTQMRFKSYPELILNLCPIQARLSNEGHFRVLKGFDPQGCMILHMTVGLWNPNPDAKLAIEEWLQEFCCYMDYFMRNEVSLCKEGVVAILDARDWEYRHVRPLSLSNLIKITNVVLKYPVRFKGIHIIMSSFVLKSLFNLIYPFFPSKFAGRIKIHKTADGLTEHIPKELLSTNLNGLLSNDVAYDITYPERLKTQELHFTQLAAALGM